MAARARKRPLRVVTPDDTPPSPKSVTEAASGGTTRELLVAMQTRIAEAVEDKNTPARDLASLTKRLMEVTRDIEAIDAREKQEGERGGPVPDEAFDSAAI